MTEFSGYVFEALREGGEFALYRGRQASNSVPILMLAPVVGLQESVTLGRLENELSLAQQLDPAWAVRPLELARHDGRTILVLADPGGNPLHEAFGRPPDLRQFLVVAIALAAALRHVHQRGLIHKDIKPSNALVDDAGNVRLTGFGIASRLPRELQSPMPPEIIAGTFAYMAPEQTGRMNRSIDARSDLYSLGVTLYEMLTGSLPFTASDPMEWIHCHIARQPAPPSDRRAEIPPPVEAIVLKLLAKSAEDRYQTAAGLEADLRTCLKAWDAHQAIAPFPLATHDVPDRLVIPEKLYGRESEIEALIAAFDRVVTHGATELVLVSGNAGIGKSSLVNELHKELVPSRGLFAAGKFDQYKRNIPYATLAQAFRKLVHQSLGKSDVEMSQLRSALLEALGPNGLLMVNLIPELALIVGEQPPVPELPPQDQQNRFQLVFRRFLGVFARPEHPLALFLDDLQWLDTASLDLIEHLVTHPEVRHLLLIGAYRDNEVDPLHPLMARLATIRDAGGRVSEIPLAPIDPDDIERLLADALHSEEPHARPLAALIFEKTDGNPFFTIQFLIELAEEALLVFDPVTLAWTWDLSRIRAKGFTDNVADLMATKLARLPEATQMTLGHLACLGHVAETAALALVQGGTEEAIHAALWEAVRAGLIFRSDSTYTFLHDRIQEAASALVADGERAETHLRIGRLLAARAAPEELEEKIFDIVNQFDRGAALLTAAKEREQVAAFNLIAGKRAKAATAYASALQYFATGGALLAEDGWERCYRLNFDLEINRAECEYLTSELPAAGQRLLSLSQRATSLVDQAAVVRVRMSLYTNLDRTSRAVEVGLEFLRHAGVEWTPHPTDEDVNRELERMRALLAGRPIEELIDLPIMTNADWLSTMDVLTELLPPARFTDNNLHDLALLRMVNFSLEHGNCDASCHAYAALNIPLRLRCGAYQEGFRFGQLGSDLVDRRGLVRFKARVYLAFGAIATPWAKHLLAGRALTQRAFDTANAMGDLTYAVYSVKNLVTNLLVSGEPLRNVQREAEQALAFARKARFGQYVDAFIEQLMLIRELRGLEPDIFRLEGMSKDDRWFETHLKEAGPRLALVASWYWIHRMQACVFAGNNAGGVAAASKVENLLWATQSHFEIAEYHFYGALTRAAACTAATGAERARHAQALQGHYERIAVWAQNCPENFANRAALVGAEIARLEGRDLDAMRLYDDAVRSAREHGFVQNEGLANELAARFHAARGFETIAGIYLRNAHSCYVRWGADGKVRQMEQAHAQLRPEPTSQRSEDTIGTTVEHLDLATVIKVSHAVSSEIDRKKLIVALMEIALEHAGGERGLLIIPHDGGLQIVAEATTVRDIVEVRLREADISPAELPETVLRYVVRTQENLLLDDALSQHPFSDDQYVRTNRCRSILCLPLVKQAKLVGVLYLEHRQAPHVFTPARIAVLKLLASQAAISLENAHLYADLKHTEAYLAEAQRLSQTGSFALCPSRKRLFWSDEVYRIYEFDRSARLTLRLPGTRTHPEDTNLAHKIVAAAQPGGGACEIEHRLLMPDGRVKHLQIVVHAEIDESGEVEYVGTVMDVTTSKRIQERLQASIDRMQMLGSVIENGTDFIGYAATEGQTGYLNAAGRRLVGLDLKEDLSGIEVSDFHPEEENRRFATEILPSLLRDGHWEGERVLRHFKTKALIPVLQTIFYITEGGSDRRIGIATICRDITERKRIEDSQRASLEEKEALLKEVHHRVKNNLQLISSLLNLQAARITDPAVVELFAESRNRVRSMALVHENLYRAGNFARISMGSHIQNLCAQLIRAYGVQRQRVELKTDVDDVELDLDRAVSIGLIINELVSNALKHAFPDEQAGCIRVALKCHGTARHVLTVIDNGVGFLPDADADRVDSFGLRLVRDLTHQLHGAIEIGRGAGTCVTVTFDACKRGEAPT